MKVYLKIWQAFRNVAYVFFALIFVVVGFAIMFRVKISPQAIVTIQSALPKLVIALILTTFSYAIVGFLVDLMFVATNLIISVFLHIDGVPQWLQSLMNVGPIIDDRRLFNTMFWAGLPAVIAPMLILLLAPGVFGYWVVGLIMVFIVAIIFLIALIRILWTLLKAYVFVALSLIFAPFVLLVGALPGSNTIETWFRNLIANLAVFPVMMVLSFTAGYLALSILTMIGAFGEKLLTYLGGGDFGALATMAGSLPTEIGPIFIMFFVPAGILLLMPKAADIIQSFITKKPFGYGTAIGEATMAPYTVPARIIEPVSKTITAAAGGIRNYPTVRDSVRDSLKNLRGGSDSNAAPG